MVPARIPATARREDAAHCRVTELLRLRRESDLELARLLARVSESRSYLFDSASSLGDWGERHGLSARETRDLAGAGKAVSVAPVLEARIRAGRVSMESASHVGRVLSDPSLVRPGEDWLRWAETLPARELGRRVRHRLEEARLGCTPLVMTLHLSPSFQDAFDRARTLASRKTHRMLSEGETVEVVVDHYLGCEDPLRAEAGTRRLPDTASIPGERYIPSGVRREVSGRTSDHCAVPGCGNRVFLQYAHREAHAAGGSREAGNLLRLCTVHHRLLDDGDLRVEGPSESPVFADADGHVLTARAPP